MPAAEEPKAGVCAEVLALVILASLLGSWNAPFGRCRAISSRTSAHGQKRKRQSAFATAGLPPKADITRTGWHFRFVPFPEVLAHW